jgi:DNA-binding MarR family transcriptional regulator
MKRRGPHPRPFLWLTDEDIAAARRVLLVLSEREAGAADGHPDGRNLAVPDPRNLFDRAELLLAMRERRIHVFGARFSTEQPFAMLLALYVIEDREPAITVSRLAELACINMTTTLRWLDILLKQGWLSRTSTQDRRKAQISLTEKSREAMERLLGSAG